MIYHCPCCNGKCEGINGNKGWVCPHCKVGIPRHMAHYFENERAKIAFDKQLDIWMYEAHLVEPEVYEEKEEE